MRENLANKYLKGKGVEIGALHCPTPLPFGAEALYVDRASGEGLKQFHSDVVPAKVEIIVDDGETMGLFGADTFDFLIANHVLEHLENPILALENWARVVKVGGILMISLPEKNHTFDRKREVTSFEHLLYDYSFGPEHFRESHYQDWFANSELEGVSGGELERKVKAAMDTRANIHFHVFDEASMYEMFSGVEPLGLRIVEATVNGSEMIYMLIKNGAKK